MPGGALAANTLGTPIRSVAYWDANTPPANATSANTQRPGRGPGGQHAGDAGHRDDRLAGRARLQARRPRRDTGEMGDACLSSEYAPLLDIRANAVRACVCVCVCFPRVRARGPGTCPCFLYAVYQCRLRVCMFGYTRVSASVLLCLVALHLCLCSGAWVCALGSGPRSMIRAARFCTLRESENTRTCDNRTRFESYTSGRCLA